MAFNNEVDKAIKKIENDEKLGLVSRIMGSRSLMALQLDTKDKINIVLNDVVISFDSNRQFSIKGNQELYLLELESFLKESKAVLRSLQTKVHNIAEKEGDMELGFTLSLQNISSYFNMLFLRTKKNGIKAEIDEAILVHATLKRINNELERIINEIDKRNMYGYLNESIVLIKKIRDVFLNLESSQKNYHNSIVRLSRATVGLKFAQIPNEN